MPSTTLHGLPSVLITDRLAERPCRPPNYEQEAAALGLIAHTFSQRPGTLLQLLAMIASELCAGGSGGISLIESDGGKECFRWVALAGALGAFVGGCAPRDLSPCAVTLERGTPQLFLRPGRFFPDFAAVDPAIVEGLVVPFSSNGRPLGTIWVVSHSSERKFDREDVRVMSNLADFAATGYRLQAIADHVQKLEQATRATSAKLERASTSYPGNEVSSGPLISAARLMRDHADRIRSLVGSST